MQAGIYRLKHLGISGVLPSSISSAMSRLPYEAIILAAASHIERELQITPWNLSSNFYTCVIQVKYGPDFVMLVCHLCLLCVGSRRCYLLCFFFDILLSKDINTMANYFNILSC